MGGGVLGRDPAGLRGEHLAVLTQLIKFVGNICLRRGQKKGVKSSSLLQYIYNTRRNINVGEIAKGGGRWQRGKH